MSRLRRFWFVFDQIDSFRALSIGCGVTAYDHDDALQIMRKKIFEGHAVPHIQKCIADVDVSTLDSGHVLPNMGVVVRRGIWFPLGYSDLSND